MWFDHYVMRFDHYVVRFVHYVAWFLRCVVQFRHVVFGCTSGAALLIPALLVPENWFN